MQRITVRNAPSQNIKVESTPHQSVKAKNSYVIVGSFDPYMGEYHVTPSNVAQTLFTKGKGMTENVVIEPIPKNYGMIYYNGFELTIT